MGKTDNLGKDIIQPNAITSARYEYSKMQKDFMYHFIEKMNKYMTRDNELIKDLFGNMPSIEMNLKDIVKSDNYTPMLDAIKDLMKKPISYNFNRENATYEVTTTLIATILHKKGSGKIRIATTEATLPVLSYIGTGFTSFNKAIAISLPSYYAQRIYELCCRWKDKGFYRVTIKEFRKMMMIENKFAKITDLVINVLDKSEKILTKNADLTFTHTLRKENGSKAYNWLEFNIFSVSGEQGDKGGWYSLLYNIIYQVYRDLRGVMVCDYLADKGELKRAAERFKRLKKDIDTGKIQPHGILAYMNSVLKNEYGVPEEMLESGEEKKKKKKAAEKYAEIKAKREAKERREEEKRKAAENLKIETEKLRNMFEEKFGNERGQGAMKIGDILKDEM